MQKPRTFFVLGIWVAILPYLGFPILFKNILITITGLLLIYAGLVLRAKNPKSMHKKRFDNFSENSWALAKKDASQSQPIKEETVNIDTSDTL